MIKKLLLFLGILFCAATSGAQTYVQSSGAMLEASNSVTATFGSNTTAGNKIIVYFLCFGTVAACTAAPLTVTDTQSNTYVAAGTFNSAASYSLFIYESTNSTPGGADVVTIAANTFILEGGASEYSGIPTAAAFDKTAGNTGNDSGPTATTSFANELLVGWGYVNSGSPTAGSGYTVRAAAGPDQVLRFEDQTVSSTGAYNATFTGAMTRTMISTFKASSQPGGGASTKIAGPSKIGRSTKTN